MNKAEVAYEESDSSDEDFCPEKEAEAADSEVASDEEVDEESVDEEQDGEGLEMNAKKAKAAKGNKKQQKKRQRKSPKDAQDSEDEPGESTQEISRRSTRQTEESSKRYGRNGTQEKDELESEEDEKVKSRSDALWADFLSDVKPPTPAAPKNATLTLSTAKADSGGSSRKSTGATPTNGKATKFEKNDDAAAKQAVVASVIEDTPKQITVTEICDFAGEEVRMEKTINADSIKENKLSTTRAAPISTSIARVLSASVKRSAPAGSASGLGSILNQIGKKKKITVLEKSKLDWNSFKQDEGIDEELQTFNKGKDGYLERQDFLQRTDLRQFEIEKNLRQSRRNP